MIYTRVFVACLMIYSASSQVRAAGIAPWTQIASPPGGDAASFVFDTKVPGVAFAGSSQGRIYRSTNGGSTWTGVTVGGVTEEFRAIAASPKGTGLIFAFSTGSAVDGSATGRVYKSTDEGLTWQVLSNQPTSPTSLLGVGTGRGIAIDATGMIIVLSDHYAGILRSTDGGQTWANPLPPTAAYPYGLATDPGNTNVLWLSGRTRGGTEDLGAVWRSTDFGATWTVFTPSLFTQGSYPSTYGIAVQAGTETVFVTRFYTNTIGVQIGGVARSLDDGGTWTEIDTGILPGFSPGSAAGGIAFDPTTPNTIYLSTNGNLGAGGFYKSVDSGDHWTGIGTTLPAENSFVVAARPAEAGYPAVMFSGYPDILMSTDGAATWTASDQGFNDAALTAIVDDGLHRGGYYGATSTGMVRTINSGNSWTRLPPWPGLQFISSIAVDMTRTAPPLYAATLDNVWRTTNLGKTWTSIQPPLAAGLSVSALYTDSTGRLYATDTSHTFFRSTDKGTTWKASVIGNAMNFFSGIPGSSISIPDAPVGDREAGRIFALTRNGWKTSTDYGATWANTNVQPNTIDSNAESIAALHVAPYTLFYGTDPGILSLDNGNSELPVGDFPVQFNTLIAAKSKNIIYSSFILSQLYQSTDGGMTSTDIGAPLASVDSQSGESAFFSPTNEQVFTGEYDGATFRASYTSLKTLKAAPSTSRPRIKPPRSGRREF